MLCIVIVHTLVVLDAGDLYVRHAEPDPPYFTQTSLFYPSPLQVTWRCKPRCWSQAMVMWTEKNWILRLQAGTSFLSACWWHPIDVRLHFRLRSGSYDGITPFFTFCSPNHVHFVGPPACCVLFLMLFVLCPPTFCCLRFTGCSSGEAPIPQEHEGAEAAGPSGSGPSAAAVHPSPKSCAPTSSSSELGRTQEGRCPSPGLVRLGLHLAFSLRPCNPCTPHGPSDPRTPCDPCSPCNPCAQCPRVCVALHAPHAIHVMHAPSRPMRPMQPMQPMGRTGMPERESPTEPRSAMKTRLKMQGIKCANLQQVRPLQ